MISLVIAVFTWLSMVIRYYTKSSKVSISRFLFDNARAVSFLSILFAGFFLLIATGMSITVLVAGRTTGFMEECNIATINSSMAGQNLIANTTLFNLNSSNPVYNFVSQIRVKNGSNMNPASIPTSNVTSAIVSGTDRASENDDSLLAPAIKPLVNTVLNKLFQSAAPVLKLAPGSPVKGVIESAAKNAVSSIESGFKMFIQTVTTSVVRGTWKDFVNSVNGNRTASPSSAAPDIPGTTPSPTMPAAQPLNPLESGFNSFTSGVGSAASAAASGAATVASSLPPPPGLEPLAGSITGEALPELINSTFTPAVYNLVKQVAANIINAALDEVVSVLNPNNTDPRAVAIRNSTAKASTKIREMATRDVNSVVNSSLNAFAVSDWYSIHLSQYCYGRYIPEAPLRQLGSIDNSTQTNATFDPTTQIALVGERRWKKEVMGCSTIGDIRRFDLSVPLQQTLDRQDAGVVLPPIMLPAVVRDNIPKLQLVTTLVYTTQIMGVVFSSLAFITCALVLLWTPEKEMLLKLVESGSMVVLSSAVGGLLTVSVLTTVVVIGLKTFMSQIGGSLTINAQSGTLFLALTWTGSVLVTIASGLWGLFLFLRRRERRMKAEEMKAALKEEMLLSDSISEFATRSSSIYPARPYYGPYMRRPSLAQVYQAQKARPQTMHL